MWCLEFYGRHGNPQLTCYFIFLICHISNMNSIIDVFMKTARSYLRSLKTLGITYHNTPDETDANNLFHGYADAAFVYLTLPHKFM